MYKIRTKELYDKALKTGMFFEWYPTLTGNWKEDRDQIYYGIKIRHLNDLIDAVKEYIIMKQICEDSKSKDKDFLLELEKDYKRMQEVLEDASFDGYEEEYDPFAPKFIPFKDVKVGQKFKCGENVCLKIEPTKVLGIEAVILEDCISMTINQDTEVHAL